MKKLLLIALVEIFYLGTPNVFAHNLPFAADLTNKVLRTVRLQVPQAYYASNKLQEICQRIEGFHSDKICLSWAMRMKKEDPCFQITSIEQAKEIPMV